MDTGQTPTKAAPKLFARQATGLVPAVPQRASILAGSFVWWLYLHYPQFGVSNKANMFEWLLGVVAAALVFYYLVRWILRVRRGVKLELVYAEIPPE